MVGYYTDNEDLRFYVERGIDWASLVELTEDGYRAPGGFADAGEAVAFYQETLTMIGEFAAEEVAPRSAVMDKDPPRMEQGQVVQSKTLLELMEKIKGLEIHGIALPRELGGMNCPLIVPTIASELFARADVSVMSHHGFHGGIALALLLYSINEGTTTYDKEKHQIQSTRFHRQISEILRGETWGSMDITEPNAGSDMAALRTKGVLGADGVWRISGQKIFITSGHGKYHVVIARTEPLEADDAAGLKGLSLFLVPAWEDGPSGRTYFAKVERLEEKLGHHGSATAALNFEDAPGELIGKRGEGFNLMLLLMNGARLSVGFEAIGLCEAAYRAAVSYAAERKSMGKTLDRHEMIADYLDEMRTDIQAIRAIAMYGAYHEELSQRLKRALILYVEPGTMEAERMRREMKSHQRKARRVTPLLKYYASEKAVEIARRAIQIHGGVGYMVEYGVEKLLRDAIVLPIYEGTSQIQSLMAMKDTLGGIMKNPQGFVTQMAQARWRSLSARDPLERRVAKLATLSFGAQQHLLSKTAANKLKSVSQEPLKDWPQKFLKNWDPKRDFSLAMLHAERLTRLLTDQAIAEILLEQCLKFPERRELLERFLDRAEPRSRLWHEEILTTGERILSRLHEDEADKKIS
ncbi:MAG: acyl-CoA dehydrogenase family protein [Myxococcota bacterium]